MKLVLATQLNFINRSMKTQITSKQKQPKQQNLTLQMHPQLQIKLQLGRLIDSKFNTQTTLFKSHKKKLNNCLIDNIEQYQSVPYSSFKKYQLQSTPRRNPRKKLKANTRQIQVEQKTLRGVYEMRLQDLKTRFLNQKKKDNIFSLNRTNSYLEITNSHSIQDQSNSHKTATQRNIVAQKNEFKYFIRSDGKQKMVDNIAYMRKLKAKIELISLSTIMTQRVSANKQLSPSIKSIQPQLLPSRQKQLAKRGETSGYHSRTSYKKNKAFKIQEKRPTQAEYRPWSGMKMQFTNELINYL